MTIRMIPLLSLFIAAVLPTAAFAEAAKRPNFILFLNDDGGESCGHSCRKPLSDNTFLTRCNALLIAQNLPESAGISPGFVQLLPIAQRVSVANRAGCKRCGGG